MVQVPAYLQNRNRGIAEQTLDHLGSASPPYLSIMGGRFKLVDAAGDEEPITSVDPKTGIPYVDCCIIDSGPHESKIYFGQAFDPNAQSYSPPKCWSDNGVAPSINAGEPQARSCAPDPTGQHGCKWAVWGSATSKVSGKGIPACGKYQKLALAFPDDDVVFLLRVPPNSLDNLRNYFKKFTGSGVDVNQVITRISFEKDVLGTLTFVAPGQWIDEKMAAFQDKVILANGTDALVGRTDRPITSMLAGPVTGSDIAGNTVTARIEATTHPIASVSMVSAPPSTAPTIVGEPVKKRRGRPPASETQPAGTQAPFMPSEQPGGFGIQQPASPDAELAAGIRSVFGP